MTFAFYVKKIKSGSAAKNYTITNKAGLNFKIALFGQLFN
jgi:hypothetical protein